MKVVYILHESIKGGGANISFISMFEKLVNKGITPIVVMPDYGELYDKLTTQGVDCIVINYKFHIYPPGLKFNKIKNLLWTAKTMRKKIVNNAHVKKEIIKSIKDFKPDLIHTNTGVIHFGQDIAKKMDIPHIWHIREYQSLDFDMIPFPSLSNFRKKLTNKQNHCIAISKGIFEYFHLHKHKDEIIYNGVASDDKIRFTPHKKDYLLYVGRLQKNKGIEFLLDAYIKLYDEMRDKTPNLLIVGEGSSDYSKKLLETVKQKSLIDKVQFLGNVDNAFELMYYAKAMIVPSFNEAFGRITPEAIFNGCLVIGYNNAGTKEILSQRNIGLLYDTEVQLIRYLSDIIQNGIEKYFPMIQRAQEVVRNLYTIERNANNVYKMYERILELKNRD